MPSVWPYRNLTISLMTKQINDARILTGICLIIEDCSLIIKPVPRKTLKMWNNIAPYSRSFLPNQRLLRWDHGFSKHFSLLRYLQPHPGNRGTDRVPTYLITLVLRKLCANIRYKHTITPQQNIWHFSTLQFFNGYHFQTVCWCTTTMYRVICSINSWSSV